MFKKIAEQLRDKKKIVMVHGNADVDAISSAYAIAECFPEADIFAPNSIDRVSKIVTEKLQIKVLDNCDLNDYELIVVVDTSSPEQLGEGFAIPENCLVIDHHHDGGKWIGCERYIDDTKVACAQIILGILRENGIPFSRDVGLALLGGMITDGGHFQFADPDLLRDFAYILETCGIDMDEALTLTKSPVSMSEKVATMKCIERSKFERIGDMIVATSYGGSFEASGCRALMAAGADVAFVASQRDDTFRLSARATQEMVRKGINIGEIIKDIGTETITDGGGHDGAAGLSGNGDAEAMLHICMQRTMEEFRKIKRSGELGQSSPADE